MGRISVVAVVEGLAAPLVAELGLELVDVEFVKEGGRWFLRLFIDKEGGVTLDDCQAVSTRVGAKLDEVDPIAQPFFFEVSSPGIERPLKKDRDFARFRGRQVEVSTYAPVDGSKRFVGELLGLDAGVVRLRLTQGPRAGEELAIERDRVAKARLRAEF